MFDWVKQLTSGHRITPTEGQLRDRSLTADFIIIPTLQTAMDLSLIELGQQTAQRGNVEGRWLILIKQKQVNPTLR